VRKGPERPPSIDPARAAMYAGLVPIRQNRARMTFLVRRVGNRRFRARAAQCLLFAVVAAFAAALPASAAATKECFLLTQCTPVAGSWVEIPAGSVGAPAVTGATLSCPSTNQLQLAVGSDYELTGGSPLTYVSRLIAGGAGMINGGNASFLVVNFGAKSGAFRPHIGCIPLNGTQAVQSSRIDRIREVRLHPSQAATYSDGCRHGERLVRGFAGVLFDQSRPPSLRQLHGVTFTDRRVGQGIRVTVRTGREIGSHQRVELQITAICRR
jgi:hypothetical protein